MSFCHNNVTTICSDAFLIECTSVLFCTVLQVLTMQNASMHDGGSSGNASIASVDIAWIASEDQYPCRRGIVRVVMTITCR